MCFIYFIWFIGYSVIGMDVSVVNLHLRIDIVDRVIPPPQTSKLVKFAIDKGFILSGLRNLSLSRGKYKPFFISNLETFNGSKLYARDGRPVRVRAGTSLRGRVSYATSDVSGALIQVQDAPFAEVNSPYGRYAVEVVSIEVHSLRNLYLDLSSGFRIDFRTPALLSPKLGLPPSLGVRYSRARVGYTFHLPGFIYAYSLKLWNSCVPKEMRLPRPNDQDDIYAFRAAVLGNALSEVIDYRPVAETIVIGGDDSGRLRKARGFRGSMVVNLRHRSLRDAMSRALALANYLGVGRGRGIGLGEVRVEPRSGVS